jgi:hypothetical protein
VTGDCDGFVIITPVQFFGATSGGRPEGRLLPQPLEAHPLIENRAPSSLFRGLMVSLPPQAQLLEMLETVFITVATTDPTSAKLDGIIMVLFALAKFPNC